MITSRRNHNGASRQVHGFLALILVLFVSCTARKPADTSTQPDGESTYYRTAQDATQACLTALQQTLDKDTAEHGAPELQQLGQAVFQKPAWILDFEIKSGDPKRYLHCETKAGGGVSITLTSERPTP